MSKCKTCVFWSGDSDDKTSECDLIADLGTKDDAFIDVDMDDSSGLRVKFITSPEFGCSLHKAKEDGK